MRGLVGIADEVALEMILHGAILAVPRRGASAAGSTVPAASATLAVEGSMTMPQLLTGPDVWHGKDMVDSPRWIRALSPAALDEIDAALRAVRDRPWVSITRADFPLPTIGPLLAEVADELERGCGMVKLRGIPVERYSIEDLRRLYVGLASHVGTLVDQNRSGERMRDIRDEGADVGKRYGQVEAAPGQTFVSSYARTLSNGRLRFHTDRCDVVGLLCVRQARAGGVSKLASSVAVYNTILARRPDLLELLLRAYPRSRLGEEAGGERLYYLLPIFGVRDGKLTSHYSRTFVESGQLIDGAPRLTPAQIEALDYLDAVAEALSFEMVLQPGDIQLLNNHVVYHARTPFEDDATSGQDRLLLRLWLWMANSRALPDDHAVLWGDVAAGVPRGGIGPARAAAE
jgi:hypothetical protein